MERKRVMIFGAILIAVAALLACDTGTFTAFLSPGTATPTRTPRSTFTPRATATPEETPTPEASPTPAASPTPTQRIVPTARPATRVPTVPPPPPKPQFEWRQRPDLGKQGLCPQSDGTFEVKGRINAAGVGYVGGVHVILMDKNGKIISQMDSLYVEQMNVEWGVNCFEEKTMFNYQLDASAGRANQPMTLRLTRSVNDLTPISPDVKLDFPVTGGRFYIDWTK